MLSLQRGDRFLMQRDKFFFLRILSVMFLAGGLFGAVLRSSVNAAPSGNPAMQAGPSDTPETPTLTQTPTASDTLTGTTSPTETLTPTLTFTPSITNTSYPATATPIAPSYIVISEFRTTGPLGDTDEFVELYNPTGASVNIGNWTINKSNGCGNSISLLVTIYYGTLLRPGQHYLVASYASYSSIANADQRFSPGIDDNGGLALVSSGSIVDQVGMCSGTYYLEGQPLSPLPVAPLAGTPTPAPGTSVQSYERKPGGNTSCYDTNNNNRDFSLISPANPQNQASPAVMCAGVFLASPTSTVSPTVTPTRTRTPVPTFIPAVAVLNEFLPHPISDWNDDGTANVGDEYIEIINLGSIDLNVSGWRLDTGLNSPRIFTLPNLTLQPRQIVAFFGSQTGLSLSDGGATVRLLRSDGRIMDAYTYPVVEIPDRAWCRLPDGSDIWRFTCRPSPGQPNVSYTSTTPATSPAAGEGIGPGTLNGLEGGLLWVQRRWKWPVFLE
jgi:hypothetical protein